MTPFWWIVLALAAAVVWAVVYNSPANIKHRVEKNQLKEERAIEAYRKATSYNVPQPICDVCGDRRCDASRGHGACDGLALFVWEADAPSLFSPPRRKP